MRQLGGKQSARRRQGVLYGPLLLATAALLLSACGGSARDPVGKVVSATQKTAGLSWVRYQIRFTDSHLLPAAAGVTGARGAYDFKAGLDYVFVGVHKRGGGSENVFLDSSQTRLAVSPVPPPAGLLPSGKFWISAPVRGAQSAGKLAAQSQGLAPILAIDELRWGARTASSQGTQVVGQVPMDEYAVSVDLAKARSAAIKHGDAAVAAAIKQELESSPTGRLKIDVWVNGPGYLAQIYQRVPGSGLGGTSLSFISYSRPYTGTFPTASETISLASLKPGTRSVWALATGSSG